MFAVTNYLVSVQIFQDITSRLLLPSLPPLPLYLPESRKLNHLYSTNILIQVESFISNRHNKSIHDSSCTLHIPDYILLCMYQCVPCYDRHRVELMDLAPQYENLVCDS